MTALTPTQQGHDDAAPSRPPIRSVLVVIPALNEERLIGRALHALDQAVERLVRDRPAVRVTCVIVLDHCTDDTANIVATHQGSCTPTGLALDGDGVGGTVGAARAAGVVHARLLAVEAHRAESVAPTTAVCDTAGIADAPGLDPSACWVATTDADSVVPPEWLISHLDLADAGADLVLGSVEPLPEEANDDTAAIDLWHAQHVLIDGHTAIHAANLGVRLDAYDDAGGFDPADALHEDAHLVHLLRSAGRPWASTDRGRVATSTRREGRLPAGGFAAFMSSLDEALERFGTIEALDQRIRHTIHNLLNAADPRYGVTPDEVSAAAAEGTATNLSHLALAVACTLADEGVVEVIADGLPVDARTTPGPYRIRRSRAPRTRLRS